MAVWLFKVFPVEGVAGEEAVPRDVTRIAEVAFVGGVFSADSIW